MSNFQMVLLAIFGAAIVGGAIVFSGAVDLPSLKSNNSQGIESLSGSVTIWGTLPQRAVNDAIDEFTSENDDLRITYIQKNETTYDKDITEALATGASPDLFILSDHSVLKHRNKVQIAPFSIVTEKDFRDQFVQGAEVFLSNQGTVAFPLVVDPLVMYYNRTLLENAGIPLPPKNWSQLFAQVPALTEVDGRLQISQSAVPFGTYINVNRAKEILSMFFLQLGNPIVQHLSAIPTSVLGLQSQQTRQALEPTAAALKFYAEFADPLKDIYTWNSAKAPARQEFLAGNLAFYFDYGSQLFAIQTQNQNLNFTVTDVPQVEGQSGSVTYGKFYGIALSRQAPNYNLASVLVSELAFSEFPYLLSTTLQMAPAQRQLLAQTPENEYVRIFFRAALQARSWADPDREQTDEIFRSMVQDVTSGRKTYEQAINDTRSRLIRAINDVI